MRHAAIVSPYIISVIDLSTNAGLNDIDAPSSRQVFACQDLTPFSGWC
jgi:hypothetical protein